MRPIQDILTNPYFDRSAHDAKRNAGALLKLGVRPDGVKDDVMIAGYLRSIPDVRITASIISRKHTSMSIWRAPPRA